MKNVLNKTYKGFTIIEVMIVLAIAGLIMVIVFFAIPQLQRNQRDNARQNVTNRVKAEIETYASNNQGVYPFRTAPSTQTMADFQSRYISNVQIKNPKTGADYQVSIPASAAPNPADASNQMYVYPGMTCNGESVSGTFASPS